MLDLFDKVMETLIVNAISPVVARSGRIDDAIRLLKRSAVHVAVLATEQSKLALARHFDKSDRWVYKLEEDARAAQREGTLDPPRPLVYDVMNLLNTEYPRVFSVAEIVTFVQRNRRRLERSEIEAQLRVYTDTELVEAVRTEGALGYRAKARNIQIKEEGLDARLDRVGRVASFFVPTAAAYVRGDDTARFGMTLVNASPAEWAECLRDCQLYIQRRANEASERSLAADPAEENAEPFAILFGAATIDRP